MQKSRIFTLKFFLTACILSLFSLQSCQNSSDTKTLKINPLTETSDTGSPDSKDAFLVKDASYILHYKQKILKDSYGQLYISSGSDGFEQADIEDRSANPAKPRTKFTDLVKSYDGFSYSYAVQKEKTVYIYYTRNTVEYSFYKDENTLHKKIQGTYGLSCTSPDLNLDTHLVVSSWNTSVDGSGTDFNSIFSSTDLTFYPKDKKTVIGTKLKPNKAGDFVFTDGSAATIEEVKEAQWNLKDTYKKNTIALIVFDHYNKFTGSPTDGDALIGIGIQALRSIPYTEGDTACFRDEFYSQFRGFKDGSLMPKDEYTSYMYFSSNFGKEDLDYLLKFYQGTGFNVEWAAFALASSYPTLCKAKLDIETSSELLDDWYLPSWREISLVINKTDYNSLLKSACKILEFSLEPVENQWGTKIPLQFWASPSTATLATGGDFEGKMLYFAAYVTIGHDYKDLTMTPPHDGYGSDAEINDQWNGMGRRRYGTSNDFTPDSMRVLPFREF